MLTMNTSRVLRAPWIVNTAVLLAIIVTFVKDTSTTFVNMLYDSVFLLGLRHIGNMLSTKYYGCVQHLQELQASCVNSGNHSTAVTRKQHKLRRGRRGGVRVRMRRRGMRTPLPTITFLNVRSVRNKLDELSANCKYI